MICKELECCAALGGLLPSHPALCQSFPSCCFSLFARCTSFASEATRFHSVREGSRELPDWPPSRHLPTNPFSRALFVSSIQGRLRVQQASCLVLLAEMRLVFHGGLLRHQHEGVIVTRHGQAKAAIASLCLVRPADPPGKDVSLQGNRKLLEKIGFQGKQQSCWDNVSSPYDMDLVLLVWEINRN